jgi:hypothetical protein
MSRLCPDKVSKYSNPPFKDNEKEGGERRSQLNGQWKVLLLGGPWKVPLLSGLWKVPMLGGQWKEKEKHFFPSSHFPPNKFYFKPSFFSLILRFYFTVVLSRYLRISFLFLDL